MRLSKTLAALLLILSLPTISGAKAILRPGSEQPLSLAQMAEELADAKIITIGERHDSPEDHAIQRTVIQALHENGMKIALGFEMFRDSAQPMLDQWMAGRLYPTAIADIFEAEWERALYPLYQPLFLYAKQEGLPVIGLNVDRKIVSEIMKSGSDGLSDADWRKYGDISCDVDPVYAAQILGAMGHGKEAMSEEQKERLCRAQVAWDYSMAKNALAYLAKNPEKTLVIIAGGYHAWRPGIPEQAARLSALPSRVILTTPVQGALKITTDHADYLFLGEVFR